MSDAISYKSSLNLRCCCVLALEESVKTTSRDVVSAEALRSESPGSGADVSVADTSQFDKGGVEEGPENEEDSSPDDMAIVPITVETSCDDFRPESTGGEKGNCCHKLLFAMFIFNLSEMLLSCIRDAWGSGKGNC